MSKITKGNIPIISHSKGNNGIAAYTAPISRQKLFCHQTTISLADRGNFFATVQASDFYISTRVKALVSKNAIPKNSLMFICTMINMQSVKFSYGNNCCGRTEGLKILLPADPAGSPNITFMEICMRQQETHLKKQILQSFAQTNETVKKQMLPTEWREFHLHDIFPKIKRGKRLKKADHITGNMPYISSTETNNGVDAFIRNTNGVRIFENCLTLANSGSIGACFYQPFTFVASDHVTILENTSFSKYVYLFLAAVINRIAEKYSFNRELNDKRILREKIILPVKTDETPDFKLMEYYMKYEEYQQTKACIEFFINKNIS